MNTLKLAGDVLDLISHKYPPCVSFKEGSREGFDTYFEGLDEEAAIIINKFISDLNLENERLKKAWDCSFKQAWENGAEAGKYKHAFETAKNFIDSHISDPDQTNEMCEAWDEYQEVIGHLKER